MTNDTEGLKALPEPYTAASTIKCTACGAPYVPPVTIAGGAAQWLGGCAPPHRCRCGNAQWGGIVSSENVSPAQFTAAQMHQYARDNRTDLQARIDALTQERDALKASLKKANEGFEEFERKWYLACDERDEALARVKALEVDAARYQWLRDEAVWRADPDGSGDMVWCVVGSRFDEVVPIDGAQLDAEVDKRLDAARSSQPMKQEGDKP